MGLLSVCSKSVILIDTAKFLFKGDVSIYTHTSNVAISPMALSIEFAIQLLNICNLADKKIVLCIVLIHVSVLMNKLEQIFMFKGNLNLLFYCSFYWSWLVTNRSF